jgi:hypothetical protein
MVAFRLGRNVFPLLLGAVRCLDSRFSPVLRIDAVKRVRHHEFRVAQVRLFLRRPQLSGSLLQEIRQCRTVCAIFLHGVKIEQLVEAQPP